MRNAFSILLSICVCALLSCSGTDFSGSTSNSNPKDKDEDARGETLNDYDANGDLEIDKNPTQSGGFGKDGNDDSDTDSDLGDKDNPDFDIDIGDDDDLTIDEGERNCRSYVDGFVGSVYRLPGGTNRLPNFNTIDAVGEVESLQLNVAPRDWEQGFPGVDNLIEWFAIQFKAELKVEKAGRYLFKTHSDDGSILYINGDPVVDNDGTHSPTTKESSAIELEEGTADIKVEWFQGPRTHIALQVYWMPPGKGWEIIPGTSVKQRKNCDLDDLGRFE